MVNFQLFWTNKKSKIRCKDTTKNRYMQINLQNYLCISKKSSTFAADLGNE